MEVIREPNLEVVLLGSKACAVLINVVQEDGLSTA